MKLSSRKDINEFKKHLLDMIIHCEDLLFYPLNGYYIDKLSSEFNVFNYSINLYGLQNVNKITNKKKLRRYIRYEAGRIHEVLHRLRLILNFREIGYYYILIENGIVEVNGFDGILFQFNFSSWMNKFRFKIGDINA